MIFHKKIENIYQKQLFSRFDDKGYIKYFNHKDFEGLNCHGYEIESSLGHLLKGYFYSYNNYNPNRLIIFEHGMGGGHLSYMKEIELLCRNGYLVFTYDHTGCMTSGGEGTRGLTQFLHDLDDVLTKLKEDKNINTSDISIMGHSCGAYATMNILNLHQDIKKIVALCGFISVAQMINQNFPGILKGYRHHIYKLEEHNNPKYIKYDALNALKNTKSQALLIYSDNDILVKKNDHYDILYQELKDYQNIEFLLTHNKGHNPNYTNDAVENLNALATKLKKANPQTQEEKEDFKNSLDWEQMTKQDEVVWEKILSFLEEKEDA